MTKKLAPAMMAVAILLGCLGSTLAADLLILKSTDSDILPEGGILDGSKQLTLPAGAAVTLVGEAGNKINLKGPYSGVPGAAEQSAGGGGFGGRMLMALSRLITGSPRDASKLGATRGAASAVSADLWNINISMSGDHCLRADISAQFWRPRADTASALSIKRFRTKSWVKTQWPAGDDSLAWPGGLDIDDATYLVRLGAGITVSKVVLHLLPNDLPSDFHRAAWMTDKGCLRQARTLLSSLK